MAPLPPRSVDCRARSPGRAFSSRPKAIASHRILQSKCATISRRRCLRFFWRSSIRVGRLRGFRDKHLLRLWRSDGCQNRSGAAPAQGYLRAPLDSFHMEPEPAICRAGFCKRRIAGKPDTSIQPPCSMADGFSQNAAVRCRGCSVEMGRWRSRRRNLWHHLFMGGGLADLPELDTAVPTPAAN